MGLSKAAIAGSFILFLLLCLPLTVQAADDPAAPVQSGGLSCFSVEPSKQLSSSPIKSCDELCAAQGASCTGMQNSAMNPPVECADRTNTAFAVCRCCRVDK
ncbi:MAG: hypothetical protein WDO70_01275 [Alphaproteobacteria bacterium]